MKRPLHKALVHQDMKLMNGHAGLWYDKFCNQWCRNSKKSGLEKWTLEAFKSKDQETISPKQDWIDTVTRKPVGDSEQLEHHTTRLRKLLEHHHQTPLFYTLESDFVTGLGREHPVENGFAWHHTLGTPYLPGSSVKGLVRAWAEHWAEADKELFKRIFGSLPRKSEDSTSEANEVGSVIFLDALPQGRVQLKADIMTPHYSPYYQDKTGNTPPADWHSPNPIPFLVVEKEQTFVFGVLPRRHDKQSICDCKKVRKWLKEALSLLGAGAKTAVGYGRFGVDQAAQDAEVERQKAEAEAKEQAAAEAARQAKLATLPPILREMHEQGYEDEDVFKGNPMNAWLERMEQADPDERREIAGYLQKWYDTIFLSKMNQKNEKKLERIKKALT